MLYRTRSLLYLATLLLIAGLLPPPSQAQAPLIKQLVSGEWRVPGVAEQATAPQAGPSLSQTSLNFTGWGRLVYTSYKTGNAEIYLITPVPEGMLMSNLTHTGAADTYPRLNAAADLLTFVSTRDGNRELYRMNIDGSGVRRLTASPADDIQPFWAPDSGTIVFASNRSGSWDLYRVNSDGSNLTQLTSDPADDLMPAYSPDGSTIAWVRVSGASGTLWLMNADGSHPRAVTGALRYLQHPAWSPDGSRLAIDYDENGDGLNGLATLKPDGSDLQQVPVLYSLAQPGQVLDIGMGSWAPPGDWLVATMFIYSVNGHSARLRNSYIGAAALDTSNSGAIVWPAAFDMYPDMRSIDQIAPRSRMDALPEWTRGAKATVSWTSPDDGLEYPPPQFDLQYRVGSGPWVAWTSGFGYTGERKLQYSGEVGDTVAFRVRARDVAGNIEPWHSADGDTHTAFFDTQVVGQLTDNRARPVGGATIGFTPAALAPAITDHQDGRYHAYLPDAAHSTTPAAPGYASPPTTALAPGRDYHFSPYLLPLDNQLQNGGFEAGNLSGWSSSGSLPVAITTTLSLTGGKSARLGAACIGTCLGSAERIPTGPTGFSPITGGLVVDNAGTAHVLWSKLDTTVFPEVHQIYYQTRSSAGVWSAPAYLSDGNTIGLVADQHQTLHTVWLAPDLHLLYSQRPSGGAWSAPETVGVATLGRIALDHQGRLYLGYGCFSNLVCSVHGLAEYRVRALDGSWSAPHTLPSMQATFAFAPDDTAYTLWDNGFQGLVARLLPSGERGDAISFGSGYQVTEPQAVIDQNSVMHIVWNLNADTYYVELRPNSPPTLPTPLPNGGTRFRLAEAGGVVYMLNGTGTAQSSIVGTYFRAKPLAGEWSQPEKLFGSSYYSLVLATDALGRAYMVREGPMQDDGQNQYYQALAPASAGTALLRQSIAVPATLHKPTLTFGYALAGITPESGSRLVVTVSRAASSTLVFSDTVGTGWSLASIDMQPWAGSTVDLSIELRQATGGPPASALIDDVSLGSWQTPVIQTVAPNWITNPASATQLTISGENFIDAPTVRLGASVLTSIEYVDEHTLHATLPAGFMPGRYTLAVSNPGGSTALVPNVLVGHTVHLPLTTR